MRKFYFISRHYLKLWFILYYYYKTESLLEISTNIMHKLLDSWVYVLRYFSNSWHFMESDISEIKLQQCFALLWHFYLNYMWILVTTFKWNWKSFIYISLRKCNGNQLLHQTTLPLKVWSPFTLSVLSFTHILIHSRSMQWIST